MWRQAKWDEPIIFELNTSGTERQGVLIPKEEELSQIDINLPDYLRRNEVNLPELTENEVVRHFVRLSQMSYGVDVGMMPLGSCTMKYNPKIEEASQVITEEYHPLQDEKTVQGTLEMMYEIQEWLKEVTGMDACSLQVPAGSAGELAGVLMIKKYHNETGNVKDEMLVADTAHGTNPASASMAGFKVIYIRSNKEGLVDTELLKATAGERTAGFMLTNPNTLGLFEENIADIAKVIHEHNGILYYDGANLNGILGIVRPGDMGFDVVHLNLHKTFGVPHGGGGPGAGAICAKGKMVDYLPYPLIEKSETFYAAIPKKSIGKLTSFHGNIGNVARAYVYILGLGKEGVSQIGKMSTLATNYLIYALKDTKLELMSPERPRKHEVVFSAKRIADETGVTAFDIAKALLDDGFYAPTIYFPPIVEEALMIEPTETESIETIRSFANSLKRILDEAYRNPEKLRDSPYNTAVGRLDQARANHPASVTPSYRIERKRRESKNDLILK
ncbi:aminomethyl-transferring glycine dehydrogenase subunit GcvPB [Sulfuracidifex metallicus DSM 6482 = JCM 9184]|nr:aminomethyl-transferring glycine dehydrogenase subunit GcvPB [Sulfuracidifex metallicus DSM 6482 = JCM 9184]